MKHLLYVGKFNKWNDKHENELLDALETFDKVTICVMIDNKRKTPKKDQPKKILDSEFKSRLKIIYFKKLKNLLNAKKDCKYILFER